MVWKIPRREPIFLRPLFAAYRLLRPLGLALPRLLCIPSCHVLRLPTRLKSFVVRRVPQIYRAKDGDQLELIACVSPVCLLTAEARYAALDQADVGYAAPGSQGASRILQVSGQAYR